MIRQGRQLVYFHCALLTSTLLILEYFTIRMPRDLHECAALSSLLFSPMEANVTMQRSTSTFNRVLDAYLCVH